MSTSIAIDLAVAKSLETLHSGEVSGKIAAACILLGVPPHAVNESVLKFAKRERVRRAFGGTPTDLGN